MRNSRFFARLFLLATLCIGAPSLHAQTVIPIPQETEQAEGLFTLNAQTKLSCNLQGDEREQLLDYLKQQPLLQACLKNGDAAAPKQAGIFLQKLDNDEFGYCENCGIEIGIKRLEARPTADLCVDCKALAEIKEKQLGD